MADSAPRSNLSCGNRLCTRDERLNHERQAFRPLRDGDEERIRRPHRRLGDRRSRVAFRRAQTRARVHELENSKTVRGGREQDAASSSEADSCADRLYSVFPPLFVDVGDHHFRRRSNSAYAIHVDALRITFRDELDM